MESHTTSVPLKGRNRCQRLGWIGSTTKVHLKVPVMYVVGSHRTLALLGWLDLQQYYISAFKSGGVYPSVLRDRIFLWARLHPASADAPQDGIGRPLGWQYVCSPAVFSLTLVSADTDTLIDRRHSLGDDLFHRWERLRDVELWRLLRNG